MAVKKQYKILERDPSLAGFEKDIALRMDLYKDMKNRLVGEKGSLAAFANGSLHYGFHPMLGGMVYREWAPGAEKMSLVGDFNGWNGDANPMHKVGPNGDWEVTVPVLPHGSLVKARVTSGGKTFDRIPLYIHRVIQDKITFQFCGQVWNPERPFQWTDGDYVTRRTGLKVYESHVGMSSEEGKVASYDEFTEQVLPRIKAEGYNTVQLMAIMQHPYYASFGYQVSNFFAASAWYGEPEGLKRLVNRAHELGINVLLDLVHSHAVKNTAEGINEFDGTTYQFFHAGPEGDHPAWGTKCFDYGKPAVIHFLLSNLKYWMEEYHFDGFRFDGVTSMLYKDHGLGTAFGDYKKYFSMNTDTQAITYLQLANELIHEVNPNAVTIAEDMSAMPGMCLPISEGGVGFDYRLSMGLPDFWVRAVSKTPDQDWDIGKMWYELTTRRPGEKTIAYCESHDQALVGDKTIMFWLADKDMYWHMQRDDKSPVVDRAMALHKMIRLATFSLGGDGYLTFMGNEFGHPEWIDFPREGNGNSYQYCRRQWSLAANPDLKYQYLAAFDKAMLELSEKGSLLTPKGGELLSIAHNVQTFAYERGDYLFIFNWNPTSDLLVNLSKLQGKKYRYVFSTLEDRFGGWVCPTNQPFPKTLEQTALWVPHRCAVVFKKVR